MLEAVVSPASGGLAPRNTPVGRIVALDCRGREIANIKEARTKREAMCVGHATAGGEGGDKSSSSPIKLKNRVGQTRDMVKDVKIPVRSKLHKSRVG
jgi:hypothetical protein